MTTEEGNKLIAEFMGVKWQPIRKVWIFPSGSTVGDINGYHSSWDWLMPVWIKFRNLWYESDKKNTEWEAWITSLSYYLTTSDEPKRFCERLIYAITWYNQNSKS